MGTIAGDASDSADRSAGIGDAFDSFFQNQALFGRYRIPALIALLTGVAWAFQPVATFYALEPDVRVDIMNAAAAQWILHFVAPFGIWLFLWVAFFVLVKAFDGRCRTGRLFKLSGWGLAPFALTGLVRAAGNYYAFQGEELPHEVRRGVMEAELRGYENMVAEVGADPVIVAATGASLLFLLPAGYLLSHAVRHSTDLDRRQVLAVVAVPLAVYAAWTLANLLVTVPL